MVTEEHGRNGRHVGSERPNGDTALHNLEYLDSLNGLHSQAEGRLFR